MGLEERLVPLCFPAPAFASHTWIRPCPIVGTDPRASLVPRLTLGPRALTRALHSGAFLSALALGRLLGSPCLLWSTIGAAVSPSSTIGRERPGVGIRVQQSVQVMNENISFETWLTSVLSEQPPAGIAAYNFNLAQCGDWIVEVIGASVYDKNDDEWACPPNAWISCPPDFSIPRHIAPTWELALAYVCERVDLYLTGGDHPHAKGMREAEAVCVGFVDGGLTLVWSKNVD